MRADRLVATLLLLQTRGRVTAADVAAELEVSLATARRDLEALSTAGIPVYPQPGRGGGWSLVGGARTDLSGLTSSEARALFLLLGSGGGGGTEATAALRKLLHALPAPFRADAEAAAQAVVVDPARWGDADRARPAVVEQLQDAVVRRTRLRLGYANRRGESVREVDPYGLVDKDDVWYLVAGTSAGRRTFRTDRIGSVEPTGESFTRPDDFDLARAWQEVVDTVEARRDLVVATVLVDARFTDVLQTQFGRHTRVVADEPDGRQRVHVSAPSALDVARNLAGWGSGLEVLDPPSVRAELARIGAELVAAHPPADPADVRSRGAGPRG